MYIKHVLLCACATACALSWSAPDARRLGAGEHASYSPDGSHIAFHAERNGHLAVGVMPASGGDATWVKDGPGHACHPSWGADGSVLYAYVYDPHTALEAKRLKYSGGCGIWRWKDGEESRLTSGRAFDYSPSCGKDGVVRFVTTRGNERASLGSTKGKIPPGGWLCSSRLAHLDGTNIVEDIVLKGVNKGVVQPVLSPDGRFLLWSQLNGFRSCWRIVAARADAFGEPLELTTVKGPSYAARWSADGTRICYTAHREGDPGWSVYVQRLSDGAEVRVATGRNPCFTPDGASVLYDAEGSLFVRPVPEFPAIRKQPPARAKMFGGDAK